ncbi:MAG TPA: NUDIX domain-containing protein [Candidatus Saccharimonadales bacterium]|nr:NUDIX domain-containing protein [Candidatus Saccharimonadales bacterium]
MKLEIDIHPAQAEILNVLLFNPTAKFGELNKTGLGSDHFNFHLKRLLELGLVEKIDGGSYRLSVIGKEFAGRFDTEQMVIERQAKLGALLVPAREQAGTMKYLVQRRLKQPFYGYWGLLGGKIRWGETVLEAAGRELKEETGLSGQLKLGVILHKMDYTPAGEMLEDKFFYIVRVGQVAGELIETFDSGRNAWKSLPEIEELERQGQAFEHIGQMVKLAQAKQLDFVEHKYTYTQAEY